MLKGIQPGALVAIVALGSEAEGVVLQHHPNVRRVRFGVPLGVGGVLRTEIVARLPSLGPEHPLAKRVGFARPSGVVRVVAELPFAVCLLATGLRLLF